MHKLTIPFLNAVSDSLDKIKDLIPKLADQLQVPVQELLYLDSSHRGIIKNTNWEYSHWRYRCDLVHTKDKRELIVTFGPKGRIDTFSHWKVYEYIGQSKPPWPEYKELKKFLFPQDNENEKILNWYERNALIQEELKANKFDYIKKMRQGGENTLLIMDELEANELIAHPYPELCRFVEKFTTTTTDDEGHTVIELPEGSTKNESFDIKVCDLWIISEKGKDQIKKHQT